MPESGALAEEDAFFFRLGDPLGDDFQAVGLEQGADAVGCVAIGEEQADGFAGAEVEGFVVNRDLTRMGHFAEKGCRSRLRPALADKSCRLQSTEFQGFGTMKHGF
jgi:hypothetical protein